MRTTTSAFSMAALASPEITLLENIVLGSGGLINGASGSSALRKSSMGGSSSYSTTIFDKSLFRGFFGVSGYRAKGLSHEPDLVAGEQESLGLGVDHYGASRNVPGGDHCLDARHGLGGASVDGYDVGVVDLAAKDLRVEDAGHLEVGGIAGDTCHLVPVVEAGDAGADSGAPVSRFSSGQGPIADCLGRSRGQPRPP